MEMQRRYRGWMPDFFQVDSVGEIIELLWSSTGKRPCLQVMDTAVGNMMLLELHRDKNLLTIEHYSHLPETDETRWEEPYGAVTEVERYIDAGDSEGAWFYLCTKGRRLIGQYDNMLRARDAATKAAIRRFRRLLRSHTNIKCKVVGPTDRSDAMLDGILRSESGEELARAVRARHAPE